MGTEPVQLGKLIDHVIGVFGLHDKFHGWKIVHKWPEIVGPDIARQSRAVRFSDGILTVVVERDAWRQELEMQREQILQRIHHLPKGSVVKKIVLKAGTVTENIDGKDSSGR
jgi:hypothetical protein